jgi:hypothetical protein
MIVALDRLFGFDQALLQHGHAAQVTADGDDAAFRTHLDCAVHDRQVLRAAGVVHLPPARSDLPLRIAHHRLDLGTTLGRDDIGPCLPHPRTIDDLREFLAAERHVANDAFLVDDQGDVGRSGDQLAGTVGVQTAQPLLRRLE